MPVRLITRQVLEHTFHASMGWKQAFDGHHLSMLTWLSIDLANTEHLIAQSDLPLLLQENRFEDRDRRPISTRALGNSLGLDVETVRRCASRLVDRGYCERLADGLIVRSDAYERDEIRIASEGALEELSSLFRALEYWAPRSEIGWPPVVQSRPWDDKINSSGLFSRIITLLFMQFIVRFGVEMQSAFDRNVITSDVFLCVFTANYRPLLRNNELNFKYATWDTPPPAALREPISIRGIARRLNTAVETTRRHVARLGELGLIEKQGGGFVVSSEAIARPSFVKVVGDINASLLLMLRRMERVAAAQAGED
ncbi:hypothetical protein [Phenylobacterium sp.]|uniref:hypothetical protein n=1 Tax=Phenylobacterium sp. TaxID=1871053 RepID=UPI0030F3EB36